MGQKLLKFYDAIKSDGGFQAQMRLAMKTGLAAPSAATAPDSPENLQKFIKAYQDITGKPAPVN